MRSWLKELRESKGYSQQFVANVLGISQQYYCYIENRERQVDLALSTITKLSKCFDVTVEKIIEYENYKTGTAKSVKMLKIKTPKSRN